MGHIAEARGFHVVALPWGDCYQQKDTIRVALGYPFFRDPLQGFGQDDRDRPAPRASILSHH
jgi:hypothetical protein